LGLNVKRGLEASGGFELLTFGLFCETFNATEVGGLGSGARNRSRLRAKDPDEVGKGTFVRLIPGPGTLARFELCATWFDPEF